MNAQFFFHLISRTCRVALLGASLMLIPGQALATLTAKANHDRITIDSFYHGSSVSVRGQCDRDTDLLIKITAPNGHLALKEKGKVGGLLWMNVAELNFGNTPNLYLVTSTKRPEALLSQEEADLNVLGYEALKKHFSVEPVADQAEKVKWADEFIRYKENQKLYRQETGGITFTDGNDGGRSFYTLLNWPYQAQPGEYQVDVYEVKDGKVMATAQSKVMVEQTGAVKYLATMAKENGAAYGMLSIVVAVLSGFGVGMIFRKGGGAH